MISQPDRGWCPDCRSSRWSYQTTDEGSCEECGADVVDEWPLWARINRHALRAGVAVFVAAVLLGPPAWAVWKAITYEGPLYATRTMRTTRVEHYGLLVDVGSAIGPWLVLVLILFAIPYAPRQT